MSRMTAYIIGWMMSLMCLLALTGCASDNGETVASNPAQPTQPTQPVQTPIALSAYTAQPIATTRANQGLLAEGGIPDEKSIGVFAYYHENSTWAADDAADPKRTQPDFMFNQLATKKTSEDGFSYSPLKYWPNTNQDKLSFFGYYPYTTTFGAGYSSSDPYGIALLSGSDDAGLPQFEFTVKNDVDEQVDFLISDLLTDLPNGTSAVTPSSATDRRSLTIVDKVRLLFHHATSKVTIRIAVDDAIREDFMSMTISNLELTNIYRKGTVTPTYAPATGTTINVTGASESGNYIIVNVPDDPEDPVVNHLTDTYLMLPQTLLYDADEPNDPAKNAQIKLTYSIKLRSHGTVYTYDGAGNPVETDYYTYSNTASLPLASLLRADKSAIDTWDPNHHYVYTIRLGAKRIEFTGEVVKWGDDRGWDGLEIQDVLINIIET